MDKANAKDPVRFRRVHSGDPPPTLSKCSRGKSILFDQLREMRAGQWRLIDPTMLSGRLDKEPSKRLGHRISQLNSWARTHGVSHRWKWGEAIEREEARGVERGDLVVECFAADEGYIESEQQRVEHAKALRRKKP